MKTDPTLKAECIRLRVEERLSVREIERRTGLSKGTFSPWLKDYPLTEEERKEKTERGKRPSTSRHERYPNLSPFTSFMKPVQDLSRQEKGRIAEAAALLRLTLLGLVPAKPVFDGERSDWLVEIPGTTVVRRIQVKWLKHSHYGQPLCPLTSTGASGRCLHYTPKDFDVLVGYDVNTDTCHVWDWVALGSTATTVAASSSSREAWDRLLRLKGL